MKIKRKFIWWSIAATAIAALGVVSSRSAPVPVEVAVAEMGPLRSTIDEEGVTRVRDKFVVTAPVSGRLRRIELDEGDNVRRGQAIVHLSPLPLDARSHIQAEARLDAAEALEHEAGAQVAAAKANLEDALRQQARAESLAVNELLSTEQRDVARLKAQTSEQALEAAEFRARAAEFEAEVARAALLAAAPSGGQVAEDQCIEVVSPTTGTVLRVIEENERIVLAGASLLELGDPGNLEVVVDLLSVDAVKVSPGAVMSIEDWGGDANLEAVVRLVEPSGFTKVSALGVEEQRVNVVADFVDSTGGLGDGFRVETKTVLWESKTTLTIPWSALVRRELGWGVYVVVNERASWRDVEVGHRGSTAVEILRGLEAGEEVIVHPGDQVDDDVRVTQS